MGSRRQGRTGTMRGGMRVDMREEPCEENMDEKEEGGAERKG